MKKFERKFKTIEEVNSFLNNLAITYNRNYKFNLNYIPRLKDIITGYCLDLDEFGREHGEFKVRFDHFVDGSSKGCKKCSKRYHYTTKEYKDLLSLLYPYEIFHFKFDKVNYIDKNHKVTITCEKHGDFEVWPDTVISGTYLCQKCMFEELGKQKRLGTENFIKKAIELYGNDLYSFEKTEYINSHTKVTITCKKHGDFSVYPYDFLSGDSVCPLCKRSMSKGEYKITEWLKQNNYSFEHCKCVISKEIIGKNSNKIFPDFILKVNNKEIWIEYNGEQHYKFVKFFHNSYEDFLKQVRRDNSEKEYCKNHNIILLIISYTDLGNIENILEDNFKTYNTY